MIDELQFWRRHIEVPFALICVVIALLAGCSDQPKAPTSAVADPIARNAAKAVAILVNGRVCSIASTGSMVPTFDANAFVVTESVRVGAVGVGDIVVRRDGERLIVHRVMRIDGAGLVTRGDANESDDPGFVTDETIDGRVVAIIYGTQSP